MRRLHFFQSYLEGEFFNSVAIKKFEAPTRTYFKSGLKNLTRDTTYPMKQVYRLQANHQGRLTSASQKLIGVKR